MDLELDLDEDLIASMTQAALRVGLTPQNWARTALRIYLGLATPEERQRLSQRIRPIELL